MTIFFVVYSFLYDVYYNIVMPLFQNLSIDLTTFIKCFIKGHYHLWFVYLIIGLYLITPLLRLWVKDENKKYIEYFIILAFAFTYVIPEIISIGSNYSGFFKVISGIIENLSLKYVGGYTTYFILGWYINNYEIKNKKIIYMFGAIGFFVTCLGTYYLSITLEKPKQLYDNLSINVLFQTLAVFVFLKDVFSKKNDCNYGFVSMISKYSLGIYAMHPFFLSLIYNSFDKLGIRGAYICIPIAFVVAFLLSLLVSFVLGKIKGVRMIV